MAKASDSSGSSADLSEFQKLSLTNMTTSMTTKYVPTYETANNSRAVNVLSVANTIQNVSMQQRPTDEHQSWDMVDSLQQNQQDLNLTDDVQMPRGVAALAITQSTNTLMMIQQQAIEGSISASQQSVAQLMTEVNAHSLSFTSRVPARGAAAASSSTNFELQPLSMTKRRELEKEHQVVIEESINDITPVRESASRGNEITTSPTAPGPSSINEIMPSVAQTTDQSTSNYQIMSSPSARPTAPSRIGLTTDNVQTISAAPASISDIMPSVAASIDKSTNQCEIMASPVAEPTAQHKSTTNYEIMSRAAPIDQSASNYETISDAVDSVDQRSSSNEIMSMPALVPTTSSKNELGAINNMPVVPGSVTAQIPATNIQSEVQLEHGKIYTTKQDLTTIKADVIVNTAQGSLKLVAGLSAAVSNKGGPSIQAECSQYVANHGSLNECDICMTDAGDLLCKKIIHVISPKWKDGKSNEEILLYNAVMNILKKVDSMRFNSIALSAISAGINGYPIAVSLTNILKAIKEFFERNKGTRLQNIHLVDINPTVIQTMREALVKTFGESRVHNSLLVNKNLTQSISYHIYAFGQDKINKVTEALKEAYRQNGIICQNSDVPANWEPMHAAEKCRVKQLAPANVDYVTVANEFNNDSEDKYQIVKIELIQNLDLYTKVQSHKAQIKNRKAWGPEEFLCIDVWHESRQDQVNRINTTGFDKQDYNNNGDLGKGAYFYKNPPDTNCSQSLSPATQPSSLSTKSITQSTPTLRYMYRCNVLSGEFTKGKKGISDPPPKDPSNPVDMFDSVVDDVNDPTVFVVYRDTQAYPDYLVTFREK